MRCFIHLILLLEGDRLFYPKIRRLQHVGSKSYVVARLCVGGDRLSPIYDRTRTSTKVKTSRLDAGMPRIFHTSKLTAEATGSPL